MPVKNFVKLLKTTVIGIEVNMELTIENNIIQPQNGINIEDISDGIIAIKNCISIENCYFQLFVDYFQKNLGNLKHMPMVQWTPVGLLLELLRMREISPITIN